MQKIEGTDENWDNRILGADERYARRAPPELEDALNKATQNWTSQAAKGECSWTCSDCCVTVDDGMPDACVHGHQGCTDIIQRDKRIAGS